MKRYSYEYGTLDCGETTVEHKIDIVDKDGEYLDHADENETIALYAEGYLVFDRLRGHIDDRAIAFCRDRDDAQKIVDALNATTGGAG